MNSISGRLSLRPPQRAALEILARVTEIVPPGKDADVAAALAVIRSEYPSVEDFEREFPSLCFALATGVGKTRLMGAFIAYLYQTKGIRHFFVLAPNLTIYNKLRRDFTPGHPKYVLNGISDFANNPPVIITGDDYERGQGTRVQTTLFDDVHINIFNISKINAEVRGGKTPKIKRLAEYIGTSYFEYLAGLPDLVLIMDESHRYRAEAGVRVLNELKPILGLELTATPQVEQGSKAPVPFKNIIYSYPLSQAIANGFVKEPAVATRENFNKDAYTDEQLERLKLEDGVRVHEATKVELETYARNYDQPIVKPFMLVVAKDTAHANDLQKLIEEDQFFEGRYRGRVITVHSDQKGEEKDEVVERLLAVEKPDEPTEIVIHVNMLKEGWDVTNLYTIVPLRTANSKTLVEQSIGRGLRLPYAKRVGVTAVDRLTIVAHDRFQEIVDEANRPDSAIRGGIVVTHVPLEKKQSVEVKPWIDILVGAAAPAAPAGDIADQMGATQLPMKTISQHPFPTIEDQRVAKTTIEVVKQFERLPRSRDLQKPEVQAQIVREVTNAYNAGQLTIQGVVEKPDIPAVVEKAIALLIEKTIDIPRISVVPTGEITSGFRDFDLNVANVRYQPVDHEILIQHLQSNTREKVMTGVTAGDEDRLENYLVRALIDFDDISYDDQADLLYKLASQVVTHLRSYLKDDGEVTNVLQYYQRPLAELVHAQMQEQYWETQSDLEVKVAKGFVTLRPSSFSIPADESPRLFRAPVDEKQYIRGMLFTGFQKALYESAKFDSDPERRFSVILEDASDVDKWFRPSSGILRIFYRYGRGDQEYVPDFVVETNDAKLIVEIKSGTEMDDPEVKAKAKATVAWCERATTHEQSIEGKRWSYLLIPHHAVTSAATLKALIESFSAGAGAVLAAAHPFRDAAREEEGAVPLMTLRAAASGFGDPNAVEMSRWVIPQTPRRIDVGMFVAQVAGKSMEPMIPDRSYCLFAPVSGGSRRGKVLLVQHNDFTDAETGGSYTVKRYESTKVRSEGSWEITEIRLIPANPDFKPIVLRPGDEDEVRVIAELVEVLPRT
ncbi:MAG TPA: DEAD/DEAH box helicase family protein [Thermoanaerobaculia bacterium]